VRFLVSQDRRFCVAGHGVLGGFSVDEDAAQPADIPPLIGASRDPNPPTKIFVDRFGLSIQPLIVEFIQIDRCLPSPGHP